MLSPERLLRDPERLRLRMVDEQLKRRGITDHAVLNAMSSVPRHLFVPEPMWASAYKDFPLPIGYGQTISQPFIVAYMSQRLEVQQGMKVLEIGTGSGYQAAVLAAMGANVFTVERVQALHLQTRELFSALNLHNIKMKLADGTLGWTLHAPYDRIIVTAGGPDVPLPLVEQLADPGMLLIPVGSTKREQKLVRVVKENRQVSAKSLGQVTFVDLIGNHGW